MDFYCHRVGFSSMEVVGMNDDRSEYDKAFQDGLLFAHREVELWTQARLDRIPPGKNQRLRDEIKHSEKQLLQRIMGRYFA